MESSNLNERTEPITRILSDVKISPVPISIQYSNRSESTNFGIKICICIPERLSSN